MTVENGGGVTLLSTAAAFSFLLRRASKPAHSRSQGFGGVGPALTLKAGTQAAYGLQPPQRPRMPPPPPKPHTAPHRRQRLALSLMALALDPRRFTPFSESLLLFFTAAQFWLVPPLEILTQNVTQNTENSCGAERIDLRVFGDFRPKKARKALGRSGLSVWTQLITRRSEVQVLLPQP